MEGHLTRGSGERWLCVLVAVVTVAAGLLAALGTSGAHSGDVIDATWASTPPTVDGAMTPGEWAAAASVDLGAIPGNQLASFLLVMSNDTFLWVAYDAVGDTTASVNDSASFALDTGHDGVATDGGEDQFYLGDFTAHLVWRAGGPFFEDMPFDPGLPDHAGLAGARGFGPSDGSATDHRLYEFQIPLVLIGAGPADTVGFFGGSMPSPGVLDYSTFAYSTWPDYVTGPIPIDQYGNLNLAYLPGPIGVLLSPSSTGANGAPGDTIWYNLTARNIGTAVSDTFDISLSYVWTASLWDATGTVPLGDTDGDSVPDTGNLTSGSSARFVVKVDIPPAASGCDVATVTARSSWDLAVLDTSTLNTCVGPASPAAFSPPHTDYGVDTNGNLLFDYLRVEVSVEVIVSDLYIISGDLYSGDGLTFIASAWNLLSGPPGPNVVLLDFPGRTIYGSGIDGSYRVDLNLYTSVGTLIDADTYTTGAYLATDFEAPSALFRPPHSDRGVDTDVPPNGLFDELQLTVGLTVNAAGNYSLETAVYDSSFTYVTSSYDRFTLATGSPTVTIAYPGDRFYAASADGRYTIQLYLYDIRNMTDSDVHTTGPYARIDFDPPPIAFERPHSDRGLDTDVPPDGLYDWLVVSAGLRVAEAGSYTLDAALVGPGGFPFIAQASSTASLGLGPGAIDVQFPGSAIRRAGVSGNFQVYLAVRPTGSNFTTDTDVYITGYYDFTQFAPPAARFAPPHSDRGVDTSDPPDGLYDWLEVEASVNVTRSERFHVVASIGGGSGVLGVAEAYQTLPIGDGTIPVRFDGHALQAGGPGPYQVVMILLDETAVQLDMGFHITAAYTAADFQPPDGSPPTSTASVAGGYWRNGPFPVQFRATDAAPSDGLASVELQYRRSPDNATWSAWTTYDTEIVATPGDADVAGSFLFDGPAGEGYYELRTVATDRAGAVETASAADAGVGLFVPARLDLTPATGSIVAGSTRTFRVVVQNAAGQPAPLEAALVVSLLSDSPGGEFRAVGTSTAITSVTIPAGGSEVSFDYRDTRAGTSIVTVASARAGPDSAALAVAPGPVASVAIAPAVRGVGVGSSVTLTATARDAYGNEVPGATITWSIEGPGSLSATSGASVTMTANGAGTIRVNASSGTGTASLSITAFGAGVGDGGASSNLALGLGGGIALGVVFGVAIGWLVARRRKAPGADSMPPPGSPPPAAPPPPGGT